MNPDKMAFSFPVPRPGLCVSLVTVADLSFCVEPFASVKRLFVSC